MVPAAPLFTPNTALYPEDHTVSAETLDQLALVVDQLPPPSVGAAGLVPLASQVRELPRVRALKVSVMGLPVVLMNMKANSSKELTPPSNGITGFVKTRCVTELTPLTPFIARPAAARVELLVPREMPVAAEFMSNWIWLVY